MVLLFAFREGSVPRRVPSKNRELRECSSGGMAVDPRRMIRLALGRDIRYGLKAAAISKMRICRSPTMLSLMPKFIEFF